MLSLIVGQKGKGKTKILLNKANTSIKELSGDMIYIDKDSTKMYELNNKIRLINLSSYPVSSLEGLISFIAGLVSANRDIQEIYLDSYLKLAGLEDASLTKLEESINQLIEVGKTFGVSFTLSISKAQEEIPDTLKEYIYHE